MTVPFKFVAKYTLVQLYSGMARIDFASLLGESLACTNSGTKAIAWLTKKRLIRTDAGDFIITAKGRRYVEKKRLLHNLLFARATRETESRVGKSSEEGEV